MTDLGAAAAAVIAVSGGASVVCLGLGLYTPRQLRDAGDAIGETLRSHYETVLAEEVPAELAELVEALGADREE